MPQQGVSDCPCWQGKAGSWEEELRPVSRYMIDRLAGDLLRELGYSGDDWWPTWGLQKVFVPPFGTAAIFMRAAGRRVRWAGAQLLGPRLAQQIPDRSLIGK